MDEGFIQCMKWGVLAIFGILAILFLIPIVFGGRR